MHAWEITGMEQNPFNAQKMDANDPNALYSWSLCPVGSGWQTSSGMNYSEVTLLMQYFGVDTTSELVGKTFESERDSASSALNLLLVQIRQGGDYTPPTHDDLLKRASKALANMQEPDFGDVDDETVFDAFQAVWDGFRAEENWLSAFKAEIEQLSNGAVILIDANYEEFPVRVKGPANYMELVKGDQRQKVILGPYSTPVSFVS